MEAPAKTLIQFEIPGLMSVCELLFAAAFMKAGDPLWAVPTMTLFSLAGIILFYVLYSGAQYFISETKRQHAAAAA
jgi:hypothetical protein